MLYYNTFNIDMTSFTPNRLLSDHMSKQKKNKMHHAHSHHSHSHHHGHSHDHHHHAHHHENHWLKATLGLLWGVGLLVLSVGGFSIPITAYYALTGLTSLMTLYLGHSVYQSAWQSFRQNKWDMTTLYSISTLSILIVSLASTMVPGLPMMFEAAPLVLGFWHLGEGIEHTLIDQINKKLDVRDCIPSKVLLRGEVDKKISVKKLVPDNLITIQKGDIIPVDGVLTTDALLYTTRINGSSELKMFKAGAIVQSGMRLADHIPSLEMRVTATYKKSYLSLMAKEIKKADEEKAPIELIANKILDYFIPGLLIIATISGVAISSLFGIAPAIQCVISVLVSACPCALSLITPMAVKIGMNKAAEQGIQFSNGAALQAAADIDTVVFDLNGTLTQGKMQVQALQISDKRLLAHIALLESKADHPAAKTIADYILSQEDVSDEHLEITDIDKSHHSGIKALINGERFIIGNKDMLLANDIMQINEPYNNPKNGSTYIVRGNTVIGQISLMDPLREDAIATIKQLKHLGKSVHICTGADQETAERYAVLLGISKENICSNTVGVSTKDHEISKLSYIQRLKDKGYKVAMIGDAANDAAAIAGAHIGIAVESKIGDNSAKQYAGIVVQEGLLFPIATAFDVAQKGKQNIIQNYFISLTYNSTITLVASGLFVAVGFTLAPPVGIALMVLETTVVLSNLYRFKQQDIVATVANNPSVEDLGLKNDSPSVMLRLGHRHQVTSTLETEPVNTNLFASAGLNSHFLTPQSETTFHI